MDQETRDAWVADAIGDTKSRLTSLESGSASHADVADAVYGEGDHIQTIKDALAELGSPFEEPAETAADEPPVEPPIPEDVPAPEPHPVN